MEWPRVSFEEVATTTPPPPPNINNYTQFLQCQHYHTLQQAAQHASDKATQQYNLAMASSLPSSSPYNNVASAHDLISYMNPPAATPGAPSYDTCGGAKQLFSNHHCMDGPSHGSTPPFDNYHYMHSSYSGGTSPTNGTTPFGNSHYMEASYSGGNTSTRLHSSYSEDSSLKSHVSSSSSSNGSHTVRAQSNGNNLQGGPCLRWPNGNFSFEVDRSLMSTPSKPDLGWQFTQLWTRKLPTITKRRFYCLGVFECPASGCSWGCKATAT